LAHLSFPDEKEKYDPNTFRDAILQGLTEAGTDLDQASHVSWELQISAVAKCFFTT